MATKMKSRGNGTVKIGSIGGTAKAAKDKIKGIPFGVLLAGKVHDGSKTVTRRVVAINGNPVLEPITIEKTDSGFVYNRDLGDFSATGVMPCPYQVGQILYVREPWQAAAKYDRPSGSGHIPDDGEIAYLSDNGGTRHEFGGRRRIARFMPKRFARTFVRVTGVRRERLGEIDESDAILEGIRATINEVNGDGGWTYGDGKLFFDTAAGAFFHLWDAVNGKDAHLQNPWVWVIEFERVEMPNPWNEEMGFAWGWRRAMVGFVSDACTGLVLQVVPDMATGLVVGFLNETNLGDYKTYPAAQLACQEAARNHFLNLSK